MPYCRKCGAELNEGVKFCPACGTPREAVLPKFGRPRTKKRPMSTLTIVLIVLVVVVVAAAVIGIVFLGIFFPFSRIVGSGNLVAEIKDFSDFTAISVGSGFSVTIIPASSYSVSITTDDNVVDQVAISQKEDTLIIGLNLGSYESLTLNAEITMPELNKLELSGGAHGTISGFSSSHKLVLGLSGGSYLTGNFTTSGDAQFTLSGGSRITQLYGAANDLLINAGGGSHLDLSNFPVHDATVNLSSGSDATVTLDGRLDSDLSGGSHLYYLGEPTIGEINETGGSTVSKK